MTEDYLHYIWKYRLFDVSDLKTTDNQIVELVHGGTHNPNSGPDFLEARIKIGDKMWAGHVELHVRSSDWSRHKHQFDKAYNNVVLHVVYQADGDAELENGAHLPTLELHGRFDEMGYWRYEQFVGNQRFLACENMLAEVDEIHREHMLNRAVVARLAEKAAHVKTVYQQCNQNWSDTFYHMLCYTFGLKVNAEAMQVLASRLPQKVLRKHAGNVFQIEAMLLGTAGLLADVDEYSTQLAREYQFLAKKYGLVPLESSHFKFARLRPHSFPTLRLAQLSAIISTTPDLFGWMLETVDIQQVKQSLQVETSLYWHSHFRFGKSANRVSKKPADAFVHLVVINALVPTLFAYAKHTGNETLQQRALDWLFALPAEKNSIVAKMNAAGFSMKSAYQTQAALHLYRNFCKQRKCLNCAIGVKLLRL